MKNSDTRRLWWMNFSDVSAIGLGLWLLHPGLWCIAAGAFVLNCAKEKQRDLRRSGGRP